MPRTRVLRILLTRAGGDRAPATARDPVRGGDRAAPDSRFRAELR